MIIREKFQFFGKVFNPASEWLGGRVVGLNYSACLSLGGHCISLAHRQDGPHPLNRQGNDRGTHYKSGVYYHSEEHSLVEIPEIPEIPKITEIPEIPEIPFDLL